MTRQPASPLPPGQAARLLEYCGGGKAGARNKALVAILWRAGLRSQEAANLELRDLVELGDGSMKIQVREPKGAHREKNPTPPRTVGIDPRAGEIVREWLRVRGSGVKSRRVFITTTGKPLQTSYLRQLLPRLAQRAGFTQRVHPHGLRHTFAAELYAEGVRIREIQLLLGHKRLATTETYLQSIGATEAVDVALQRRWNP